MRLVQQGLLIAGIFLVANTAIHAGPITFTFSGTIDGVEFDNPIPEFGVGNGFTLVITFESTTVDSNGSATTGVYDAITDIQLTIGTYTATAGSGVITVFNDDSAVGDAFQVRTTSLAGPDIDGLPLNASQLQLIDLRDEFETAFASDALPLAPFSMLPFQVTDFTLLRLRFGPAENSTFVTGQVRKLRGPASVPEPASICLFGVAATGLIVARRRRRAA